MAATSAILRNQFRRHRLVLGIQQALRQPQGLRSLLRIKSARDLGHRPHRRSRDPTFHIPAGMGPSAKMPHAPNHLFIPLRQNHEISISLVQHHPMVRKGFLHVAFFALARLDQRYGYCPFARRQARLYTIDDAQLNPQMTKHPLIPLSAGPTHSSNLRRENATDQRRLYTRRRSSYRIASGSGLLGDGKERMANHGRAERQVYRKRGRNLEREISP